MSRGLAGGSPIMPSCVVKGCFCTWKSRHTDIILHIFPNNPAIIRLWLQQTGRVGEDLEELVKKVIRGKKSDTYRMCSMHFTDDCYIQNGDRRTLKKNSIPTIFPPVSANPILSTEEEGPKRKKRKILQTTMGGVNQSPSTLSEPLLYHTAQISGDETLLLDYQPPSDQEPCRVGSLVVDQGTNTDSGNHDRFGSGGVTPKPGKKHAQTQTSVQMFTQEPEIGPKRVKHLPKSHGRYPKPVKIMDSAFHESDYEEEKEESFYVESDEDAEGEAKNGDFKCIYEGPRSPVREKKFIVFESCLNKLLAMLRCQAQSHCEDRVTHVRKSFVGSSVIVEVKCASGHTKTIWESQPRLGNQPLGDVLASGAVFYSGSSFLKILQMVKLLNLKFIGKSTYYKNQLAYLFPTVNRHWLLEQQSIFTRLKEKPVCLVGDCQCDPPGHLAKYCTYTMMDAETKKIIGFHTQQLLPILSQAHLENIAFRKSLNYILEKGVNVKMVTTDRHVGIRKIMKESYGTIHHHFDPWHMARSISNKILVQSKKKHCEVLLHWALPIRSHLWWCVKTCKENREELLERWNSLLYHVLNVHEWNSNSDYWKCQHDVPRPENAKLTNWLSKRSLAYCRLRDIVLSPSLQRDLRRVSLYCHTDSLEVFRSTCLKYRPRGFHCRMDEMVARIQLAALDHNQNVQRVHAALKKSGTVGVAGQCAKFTKAPLVKSIYERKGQDFAFDLLREVVSLVRKMERNSSRPPLLPKPPSREPKHSLAPNLDNT
ncbi:uncharacterized protein LOC130295787 isoform X1 [Hyla sarda]|uniref:uncharacterized protein LOC130295787 isoform X1 n=1 Tax=Hyla sarda TaxID=327740 RepID=UPI0024C2B5BD|nr:uncharacterized protein LOC130295787 isoform X1 [Hyla sarda]XP_056402896.1 uncharacterized protein LOC130295787 isoform X1 [Hyla sarda]XP_056402902.1 uncharacterized protein LOC130295787 isoform X1 [Hyla sarda]